MEAAKDESAYRWERRIYELSQVATDGDGKTLPLEDMPPPYQVPFRHLCNLIQIADGDVEKALAGLADASGGPNPEQIPALRARALCARYWSENCAPDEFRFRLRAAGERANLSDGEDAALRLLRDDVVARIETFTEDKQCAEAIYKVAEKAGIESKSLFRAAYQALIGKDQGPRLAGFLRTVDKQRLLDILGAY
jgi:lysyl-tRNA synthetase class 1